MEHKESMYKLYEEYKETLKKAKKALRKRQKLNAEIREKYDKPLQRVDHVQNTSDITHWNSMIEGLGESIKMIEMYLDFEDREFLQKEYDRVKKLIYNQHSYEGRIEIDGLYGIRVEDILKTICETEFEEEMAELLDEILTVRQKQVVEMYYFEGMTQEEVAEKLGIAQKNVSINLENSLEKLKNSINCEEIYKF